MLIAIDHGNYAIKTPNNSFISGLSEHTVKPPMSDEILEYGGSYWALSGKRLSYMRDKTQDGRYFILSLFAIAKELDLKGSYSPVAHLDLAVGLPPEHYGVLKGKFEQYFKNRGTIKFVYNNRPYSIFIDRVLVYPQAYSAVIPKSSLIMNTLRVFIIDIGGYTTDVLLLRNGKTDMQFCRSLETGIITMNNEYMGVHPELLIKNCKTELKLTSEYDAVKLKQMVKEIIENKLMEIEKSTTNGDATLEPISTSYDIEQMLGNLELFK